jgi:hypothetical protein
MTTPSPLPRAECLLFLAHDTWPGAMGALDKLRSECKGRICFPLFDQTKRAFTIDHIAGAQKITCAEVTRDLPYRDKHKQHPRTFWPRNIDLPLMWFFQKNPRYDYYWVMEYDVRFTGHWMDFFQHFAGNESDLLATTLFDYDFRPDWDNWNTLKSPRVVANQERVRALFPLYRISSAALRALHQAYCEGWSGHYEVTIPTVLKMQGFKLEDFGGDGAYVQAGNRNRFYRNTPGKAGLAPGTFTVTPNAIRADYPPNMLWHPIKG